MRLIWALLCLSCCNSLYSQFYLRGEVKDSRGRLLEGVRINLASQGTYPYYTGGDGTFGITMTVATDSITFNLEGYETLTKAIDARKFQSVLLKMLPSTAKQYSTKLASATTNLKKETSISFSTLGESYSSLIENDFVRADTYPETGFAMNIDKASYSNTRRFISNDMRVPQDAIRIEEMLNYFNFSKPEDKLLSNAFNCRTKVTTCPWNQKNRLLFLNITAPRLDLDSIAPSNLVFLIDISGSMDKPNRLPLLQSAFKMLVDNLRGKDTITLVTYGGGVGVALPPTGGDHKERIREVIDSLWASGDTPGEGAIRIAYDLAKKSFIPNGNNRVILATDGDFNVGQASEKELENMIIGFRQTGIYLTCLGVGMGNYKDSKLETLAKKGNGNFAYIDNIQEAQKVLVTEFTNTLYAVANNASVKINFDPRVVKEYRLIGFDNKKNAIDDSNSELEGGEVGSGHSMMAIFEIEASAKDSLLRNQDLAQISLQYLIAKTHTPAKQTFSVHYDPVAIESADSSYRFAASVAMFSSVLKQSKFVKNHTFDDVQVLAKTSVNLNDTHQKEFLSLVEKAAKLYRSSKRKKGGTGTRNR
jgi:Ca-activated chloride channel family protein